MSNLKPNTNELAQAVVDKLNHIPDVKKKVRSQKDQTLIDALKILANDIQSDSRNNKKLWYFNWCLYKICRGKKRNFENKH